MKRQPWFIFGIPSGILTAIFLYLAYTKDGEWALWAVPCFIILAASYVMAPQINWWFYKRNPPELDNTIQSFLNNHFEYYKNLAPELKKRFRDRVSLYMTGNEFMRPPSMDNSGDKRPVPEDLKAVIAALATQVNFGKKDMMTGKFENIVVYPHPFSTPQYQDFHTCEIYEPDGVLLLAADPLMMGFNTPQSFFNIGLYEYALIFKMLYPSVSYPLLQDTIWESLERISGMNPKVIESITGIPNPDILGVAAHHFFAFPDRFKTVLPEVYQLFSNIFNQNPINTGHPILDY
jgi:Mlc titration factor MtfA (ptsG expression regulator)